MSVNPKDLTLAVGQKITASIRGQRFDVSLRGWCIGQYILIDTPQLNSEPIRLAADTGCDIHFIKEGEFFTFKSSVISVITGFIPLLIVGYPRSIESHLLRKDKRLKVSCPAEFSTLVANKSVVEPCLIRDLSLTGALITHKKVLQKDTKIILRTSLETGALSDQDAVVQNVRFNPKSENETYVTGLKFPALGDANKGILQKFIDTHQEHHERVSK